MDNMSSWSSCAFELEDIEIIDHKTEDEEKLGKWHCDQCSLFFLDKGKLVDHKKKHSIQDVVKCKYCQKNISSGLVNKECYVNKKCETCEYKCSKCPQRFLRHSSLINHEKKHNSPKKKRSVNTLKKINCNATENVTVSKGFKRKLEASDVEERNREINLHESVKMKNNSKRKLNNRGKVTLDDQNIPKTSRRLSFKTNKSTEEDLLVKSPKRSTIKNSKCSEEKGFDKANKNTTTVNPQTVSTNPNLSTNENVVNYKPFSCHVCGDTFASDNVLLEHIRTHGENAAKNFKCKFCGDKFGDIYKMQYHLAICPLAEDELESSLKQVIPKNVLIKTSLNSSSPRKRGRPKKIVETTLDGDGEGSKNESTPPSPKRRYVRRRKSEVLESNGAVVHSFESPLTKQLKTFQNKDKELSCGINRNTLAKNNTDLTVADSVTDVYKESDQDDGKKKIHQCPFPRCDFKFTREKALLCHMRNHSDDFDDSLKCHKCDIPFDDIHALRQHINTCKGIKEEKDDDFHRKDACDVSPNRTFHRSRKEFVCNQCGRSHQSQEKLNRHLESCCSKFVCRICKDDFHNQHLLDEHFGYKHPPNTAYHCYICKEDFISELFLQIHQSDEHGQKTVHVRKSAKAKINIQAQQISEEIKIDDSSGPANYTCNRKSSPNSDRASTNRTQNNPATIKTSVYENKSSRHCWCSVCLVGFDSKNSMRLHFREEHIVETDSSYTCELCEVKMPFAEMMCYHLELHSSNLLSVNRFSKVISYVKQSRLSEIRNSQMKIKCEVDDEELTQVKDTHEDVNICGENLTKGFYTLGKINPVNSSKQLTTRSRIKYSPINLLSPHLMEVPLPKKQKVSSGNKNNSKNISIEDEKDLTNNSVQSLSLQVSTNEITDLLNKNRNVSGTKPSRSLRSTVRVDNSLESKEGKRISRPKFKKEKITEEDISVNAKYATRKSDFSSQNNGDSIVTEVKSTALKLPTTYRTHKRGFAKRKKKNKTKLCEPSSGISFQSNNRDTIHIHEPVKPIISSADKTYNNSLLVIDIDNEEGMEEKKIKSIHKNSEDEFVGQQSVEGEVHTGTSVNCTKSRSTIINTISNECKDSSPDVLFVSKDDDAISDRNFKLYKNSNKVVSQSPDKKSAEIKESTLSEAILEPDNKASEETESILGTNKNKMTEDFADLPSSGVQHSKKNNNSEDGKSVEDTNLLVNEETGSTASTAGESDKICCKMCTESFCNQEELLDHLDSHI